MKIILDINIVNLKGNHVHTMLRKEYETNLLPMIGMGIEDTAWHDTIEITNITCNFNENYYHIQLPCIKLENKDDCQREEDMMKLHSWKHPSA